MLAQPPSPPRCSLSLQLGHFLYLATSANASRPWRCLIWPITCTRGRVHAHRPHGNITLACAVNAHAHTLTVDVFALRVHWNTRCSHTHVIFHSAHTLTLEVFTLRRIYDDFTFINTRPLTSLSRCIRSARARPAALSCSCSIALT